MKQIFFSDIEHYLRDVYPNTLRERLCMTQEERERDYSSKDLGVVDFSTVTHLFTTWGLPAFTEEELEKYFPSLKYVFYGAGSVQYFARPFLERGVRIFSAWRQNAVPVSEYTTSTIVLSMKGFFRTHRKMFLSFEEARECFVTYGGMNHAKIGVLGDGAIGSLVISKLKEFPCEIYVYSIRMTEKQAQELGVHLATLEEIFESCDVITNHLADKPETYHILSRELLFKMKNNATFINTGRGRQVDEDALLDLLKLRPDISAVLDVMTTEPVASDHPLLHQENAYLTPHIAGCSGKELEYLGYEMIEASRICDKQNLLTCEITKELLEGLA